MARTLYSNVKQQFSQLRPGAAAAYTTWVCDHLPNEETLRASGVNIEQHRQVVRQGRGNALYAGLAACASMSSSATTWTLGNVAASRSEIEDTLHRTLCPR